MLSKSAISELTRFQTDRNLHKMKYDPLNEHASIVEEILESMGLDVPKANRPQLKLAWKEFVLQVAAHSIANDINTEESLSTDEPVVDAYCDIITFATGALLKLGYDPEKALLECSKEINSRVGSMVDGKFEKDLTKSSEWYKANYSTCLFVP